MAVVIIQVMMMPGALFSTRWMEILRLLGLGSKFKIDIGDSPWKPADSKSEKPGGHSPLLRHHKMAAPNLASVPPWGTAGVRGNVATLGVVPSTAGWMGGQGGCGKVPLPPCGLVAPGPGGFPTGARPSQCCTCAMK